MNHLDQKDRALIEALRNDGRASLTDLAKNLSMSRTTVQNRLSALQERGVITGFTVKLNQQIESGKFRAYVNLNADPKSASTIAATLSRFPLIRKLYSVSGKIDYVALVVADSVEELEQVIDDIGSVSGITGTETVIVLSTKIDRT